MISVKQSLTGKVNIGKQIVEPNLINLEITPTKEEQLFKHEGVYGYDEVKINPIPNEYIIPNGTLEISENGIKDVTNYSNVDVNIPEKEILLQDKTIEITENGTTNITVDEGYDGLGNVEVITNVEGSGGGEGKYAPRFISFNSYTGTELNEEILKLDTSNITNMYRMFVSCSNLTSLDLSNFNTSNVINMSGIFYGCSKLTELNLENWNTINADDMKQMFYGCRNLKKLDVSSFDTSKVTDMQEMFSELYVIEELDLSNFNTSNVINMINMFTDCLKLKKLDIRNFDFTKVTSYTNVFGYKNNYGDYRIPANCEIIVKNDTARNWVLARRSDLTNVKTVAEL